MLELDEFELDAALMPPELLEVELELDVELEPDVELDAELPFEPELLLEEDPVVPSGKFNLPDEEPEDALDDAE